MADKQEELVTAYQQGRISRRNFLKLIGLGTGGIALGAAGFGMLFDTFSGPPSGCVAAQTGDGAAGDDAQCAGEYEVVTVRGTRTFRVGDGETFPDDILDGSPSGVIINCPNQRDAVKINARGDDWTIRNTAVLGNRDRQGGSHTFAVNVSGTGVVDTVHLNGRYPGVGYDTGGVRVMRSHSDDILIRNVWVEGYTNHGMYLSGPGNGDGCPGPNGRMGRVRVENCYAQHNTASCFRIGTPGSHLKNCVAVGGAYEKTPGPYRGESNGSTGQQLISVERYDQAVEGCHVWHGGDTPGAAIRTQCSGFSGGCPSTDGTVTIRDCEVAGSIDDMGCSVTRENIGGDPVIRPPDGVPTTPAEAASGCGTGAGFSPETVFGRNGSGENRVC